MPKPNPEVPQNIQEWDSTSLDFAEQAIMGAIADLEAERVALANRKKKGAGHVIEYFVNGKRVQKYIRNEQLPGLLTKYTKSLLAEYAKLAEIRTERQRRAPVMPTQSQPKQTGGESGCAENFE